MKLLPIFGTAAAIAVIGAAGFAYSPRRPSDGPAVVSDAIIAELRSRERGGFIHLPKAPGLRRGDRVLIKHGPFADKLAIYPGMSGAQRVAVLLQLLGGPREVTLPRNAVEAV